MKLLGKETCLFQGDNPHVQALLISNLRSGSIFVSLCKQHSKRECMRTAKIGPHLRLLIREVYYFILDFSLRSKRVHAVLEQRTRIESQLMWPKPKIPFLGLSLL